MRPDIVVIIPPQRKMSPSVSKTRRSSALPAFCQRVADAKIFNQKFSMQRVSTARWRLSFWFAPRQRAIRHTLREQINAVPFIIKRKKLCLLAASALKNPMIKPSLERKTFQKVF